MNDAVARVGPLPAGCYRFDMQTNAAYPADDAQAIGKFNGCEHARDYTTGLRAVPTARFTCQKERPSGVIHLKEGGEQMKKHEASHFDHGLSEAQIAYVMERFADRNAFFIETIELPEALGTVPCGLHGPLTGDAPITDDEVVRLPRGTRPWLSRLTARQPKPSRMVTVIAGPHGEHACIVYTIYGGPLAPQEPDDPNCRDVEASKAFWAQHALSQ